MRYGCIGEKLSHSYSPEIHSHIGNYPYDLIELSPEELADFCRKREYDAFNVTIPYKTEIMKYLDRISAEAEKIGAVNTVVKTGGRLVGYNTDFYGMTALMRRALGDGGLRGKKVLICGTGGTSATALAVCSSLGAGEVRRVSRSGKCGALTYEEAYRSFSDADVIINCTPCGMFPHGGVSPVELGRFSRVSAVIDAIYHPLRSSLVLDAQRRGIKAVGGLYMLAAQAVRAAELFGEIGKIGEADAGKDPAEVFSSAVFSAVLKEKRNLVLCGMPRSGKSTAGALVSERSGRAFYDTDRMIEEKAGMSIPEIIAGSGEPFFRALEKDAVRFLAQVRGAVIALGGGTVLDPENVALLSADGLICLLDRPIGDIVSSLGGENDPTRPLSGNAAALRRLYEERKEIYLSCADTVIDASGTPEKTAAKLLAAEKECEYLF